MTPSISDPSFLSALAFFDRAARRMSFSDAATDLSVTPSAVSHRITALEAALGKRLFIRLTRAIRLTPEGQELAQYTRNMFDDLDTLTNRLVARKVLRVSAGPYFSASWLMQRLARFEAEHPGLRIDLTDAIGPVDMRMVDVSILWAGSDAPPAGGTLLFETRYVPVRSTPTDPSRPIWESHDPPIHFRDRDPWRRWLRSVGAPVDYAERGDILNDPNLVIDAAAHGRGVAIGIFPMILPALQSGKLHQADERITPSAKSYWILRSDPNEPLAREFEAWLLAETEVNAAGHLP